MTVIERSQNEIAQDIIDLDPRTEPLVEEWFAVLVAVRKRREAAEATNTERAVALTDEERERILWWLHKPVPPGPMKALDERIIRKLNGVGGQS